MEFLVIILVVLFIVYVVIKRKTYAEEREEREAERQAAVDKETTWCTDLYDKLIVENDKNEAQNGKPDCFFRLTELPYHAWKLWRQKYSNIYNLSEDIVVFSSQKIVYMRGKKYNFSDIVDCKITDNGYTYKKPSKITTKTDGSDVVARSLVGDVIAGPAGAIIGGSSAEKHSTITHGKEITVHDFVVKIIVNDFSNPEISVNIGRDHDKLDELCNIITLIRKNA